MRRLLCAVVFLLIAPLQAAEPDSLATARKAIDECTPRLDAQADVGYDRVAVRCPGLAAALEKSGVEQWLPQGWKEVRQQPLHRQPKRAAFAQRPRAGRARERAQAACREAQRRAGGARRRASRDQRHLAALQAMAARAARTPRS